MPSGPATQPARRPRSYLAALGGVAVAGSVLLPVVAYMAGGRVVGAYAGSRGLASYLGQIYGDALTGRPLALFLVASPLLATLPWLARAAYLRRAGRPGEGDGH